MKKKVCLLTILPVVAMMYLPDEAGGQEGAALTVPTTGKIAVSSPESGATVGDVVSSRKIPLKETTHLQEIWFSRKKALTAGDKKSAGEDLEKLYQEKLNLGIENLFLYSSALTREGEDAASAGRKDDGMSLIDKAAALSHDFPPAFFSGAWISLTHLDIAGAISYALKGLKAISNSFFYILSALGNTLFLFLGSVLISFVLYTVVLVLRYAGFFSHDLGDIFPGRPPRVATLILGLLILFLPLLLEVGPLWLIAWCLVVTFPYGNRGEKIAAVIFFLLLSASPGILNMVGSFLAATQSGSVETLAQARVGDWDQGLEESLRQRLTTDPGDRDVLLSLGLMSKKTGNFKNALQYYEKALDPSDRSAVQARLHVNMGNALAGLGDTEGAMKEYKKAIEIAPDLASAHYNLGQLFMKKGMLEGEEQLRKAKELDPDLTGYYTSIYSSHINRLLIDEDLPLDVLIRRFFLPSPQKDQLVNGLFLGLMRGVDVGKVPWLGGGGILVSLLFSLVLGKLGSARSCERCGRPSCRRCLDGAPDQLCTQCYAIYVRKEGIDPNVRIKKDAEIRKIERRRFLLSRLSAYVVPGSGQMLRGDAIQGLVFLAIFSIIVLKMIFWEGFIRDKFPVTAAFPIVQTVFLGIVLLIVYFASIMTFLRKE